MKVTITKEVTSCMNCPHMYRTMEGPICDAPGAPDYLDVLYVFPEGRKEINPKCPIKG